MKINCTISAGAAGHMRFSKTLPQLVFPAMFGSGGKDAIAEDAMQALRLVAQLQKVAEATYGLAALSREPLVAPGDSGLPIVSDAVRLDHSKGLPVDIIYPQDRDGETVEATVFRAYWAGPISTHAMVEASDEYGPSTISLSVDELEQLGFDLISGARQRRAMLADIAEHGELTVHPQDIL